MFDERGSRGWRGVALVALTYVYFLIFAQFAFLGRLAQLKLAGSSQDVILAAMAAGGILLSLVAPRLNLIPSPAQRLRIAFIACSASAIASLLPLHIFGALLIAFLIGAALGLLTVTLVTHLNAWTGHRNPILKVGLGTGIGYFICNVPSLFAATPQAQAIAAALLSLVGAALASTPADRSTPNIFSKSAQFQFLRALAAFTALVWLDSAAFYIIQHAPALKAGTWTGSPHLWTNAFIHLGAALSAGWLLQRARSALVLSAAVIALGFACLLLRDPSLALPASLFYPAGVSLYSVALVAYPSFLTSAATARERGIQAGWIYAIAGWVASGLGIGMGRNLGHVPLGFVAIAGIVVLLPAVPLLLTRRARELAVLGAALVLAFAIQRVLPSDATQGQASAVERGRRVYISEGCIHCHSQYVRPNSPDVLMWGPVESLQQIHAQQPPLIGNRRQGPDLTQVGARRSPFWLKAHLMYPRQLSPGSIMPSFALLFRDQRGDDLVAYLTSLKTGGIEQQRALQQTWVPASSAMAHADTAEGEHIYQQHCATCHDANGAALLLFESQSHEPPADLFTGPYKYLHPSDNNRLQLQLSRISKFGIPETDMPGHEYLSDQQIVSLTVFLTQSSHHP